MGIRLQKYSHIHLAADQYVVFVARNGRIIIEDQASLDGDTLRAVFVSNNNVFVGSRVNIQGKLLSLSGSLIVGEDTRLVAQNPTCTLPVDNFCIPADAVGDVQTESSANPRETCNS